MGRRNELCFHKAAFKVAWEKISKDSDFYTDFKKFVNSKIKNKNQM